MDLGTMGSARRDKQQNKDEVNNQTNRSSMTKRVFGFGCTALAVFALVSDSSSNKTEKNVMTEPPAAAQSNGSSFHQNSFGGIKNLAHPAGLRALEDDAYDFEVPLSKVDRAIPSLFKENIINNWAHYVHDEHISPFSSFLYDRPKEELQQEQKEYVEKMNKVRKEWGAWKFYDKMKKRPVANTNDFLYKDFDYDKLDDKVWQKDEEYVKEFLQEAKALVTRVKEGIYAEYGHATIPTMTEEEIQARNEIFSVKITEQGDKNLHNSAWLTPKAFDGLVKKLLHAMITNDEFYVILAGHSAAAGHGNMFHQDKIIQFHHIMEPVMDKLGVRLISRNLAMGGLGTLHYSLGAGSLYGEKDIMIWDSGMTEKGAGDRDLFNKQALLTGERMPILLTESIYGLERETSNTILHGDMVEPIGFLVQKTTDEVQGGTLPWSMQYLECEGSGICGDQDFKYHQTCWVPRKDFQPPTNQDPRTPSQVSWHPGDRNHRLQGRKVAMMVIQALEKAFEVWEEAITTEFPLNTSYWHVGSMYKKLQDELADYLKNDENESPCEKRFGYFKRACRLPMSGMGEFTPRGTDESSSIRAHLKPAPNGYVATRSKNVYTGFDLLYPEAWKIPEGDVDVHAIAIATNYKAAALNQEWKEEDEDGEDVNQRRYLRQRFEEKTNLDSKKDDNSQMPSSEVVTEEEKKEQSLYDDDDEVIPGQGWSMFGKSSGLCDGSSMSECNRSAQEKCFMYAHNDRHNCLHGDALSGWLVINIPKLENGFIIAKLQWWQPFTHPFTDGWTEVNNGKTKDTRPYFNETTGEPIDYSSEDEDGKDDRKLASSPLLQSSITHVDKYDFPFPDAVDSLTVDRERALKQAIPPLPDDMKFDIALNGKIIKTMEKEEFMGFAVEIAYNQAIFPFLDDDSVKGNPGVELGLRLRSESDPKNLAISVTHIYYS